MDKKEKALFISFKAPPEEEDRSEQSHSVSGSSVEFHYHSSRHLKSNLGRILVSTRKTYFPIKAIYFSLIPRIAQLEEPETVAKEYRRMGRDDFKRFKHPSQVL